MIRVDTAVVISKESLSTLVEGLLNEREVIGVKRRDGKFAFAPIESPDELCLDYDITLLPLKQFVLPSRETLFHYSIRNGVVITPEEDSKPRALVGVHPYDIRALDLLDAVYLGDVPDPNYAVRRENTLIIGVDCLNPSPNSFAASLGTNVVNKGFDLLLTDVGDSYVVQTGSERGAELLSRYCDVRPADARHLAQRDAARKESEKRYETSLSLSSQEIATLLEGNWDHPVWTEKGAKCLNCSSCTVVCPTCVCFDVQDEPSLSLVEGRRARKWDSCMLPDFARVATGENFRKTGTDRLRHRLHRKGKYLLERYGVLGCVGCGRCITTCLAQIASPVDIYDALMKG